MKDEAKKESALSGMVFGIMVVVIPMMAIIMMILTVSNLYYMVLDILMICCLWGIMLYLAYMYWKHVIKVTSEEAKAIVDMVIMSVATVTVPTLAVVAVIMLVPAELLIVTFIFGLIICFVVMYVSYSYGMSWWEKKHGEGGTV